MRRKIPQRARAFLPQIIAFSFLVFAAAPVLSADQRELDLSLIRASARGDIAEVRKLLAQGADVNATHKLTRWTALGTAAFYGWFEIVDLLVGKEANVNHVDAHRRTPLMKAVTLGPYGSRSRILANKMRIIRTLLEAGANPYTPDRFGEPVWQMPVVDKIPEFTRIFEEASIRESREVTLITAIALQDVPTIRKLLSQRVDIDFKDGYGWSTLRQAAFTGNAQIVKLLIDSGVNVNSRFPAGWTALMIAAKKMNSTMVNVLLQSGADPDAVNDRGDSARRIALRQGDDAINALFSAVPAR